MEIIFARIINSFNLSIYFRTMFDLCRNHLVGFNVTLPQVLFKLFASKNQLPGLSLTGTLVENGLTIFA